MRGFFVAGDSCQLAWSSSVIALLALAATGCMGDGSAGALPHGPVGSAELSLKLPDDAAIDTLKYEIVHSGGFSSEGSMEIDSPLVTFQVGHIPAGQGYAISLKAKSSNNEACGAGPIAFDISAAQTATIQLSLRCGTSAPKNGNARVDVTIAEDPDGKCARVDGLTALPGSAELGATIALHGYATTPKSKYEWSVKPEKGGSFSDHKSASTSFKCETEGTHTVTFSVCGPKSCKNNSTTLPVVCTAKGGTKPTPTPSTGGVASLEVVGTSVTSQLYTDGSFGLILLAKDANGDVVLTDDLDVEIDIDSPKDLDATVEDSTCSGPHGSEVSIGVIIDDSGSMGSTDRELKRRDAVVAFLNQLDDDEVLLTDYGVAGNNLRDLVCAQTSSRGSCAPATQAGFTKDLDALRASVAQIRASGGTPLYQSCRDMVPLVAARSGNNQAILLLSDGQPSDTNLRTACHEAAIKAQIPVYTVGLGPAAEGGTSSQPATIAVLRELAAATKGAYASAAKPEDLDHLFELIAQVTTQGSCTTTAKLTGYQSLHRGDMVTGTVKIGETGANDIFQFTLPM